MFHKLDETLDGGRIGRIVRRKPFGKEQDVGEPLLAPGVCGAGNVEESVGLPVRLGVLHFFFSRCFERISRVILAARRAKAELSALIHLNTSCRGNSEERCSYRQRRPGALPPTSSGHFIRRHFSPNVFARIEAASVHLKLSAIMLDSKPVRTPEAPGKITFSSRASGAVYVLYEYARVYDPKRKFNVPKRASIGRLAAPSDRTWMYPNKNYARYFGSGAAPQAGYSCRSRIRKASAAAARSAKPRAAGRPIPRHPVCRSKKRPRDDAQERLRERRRRSS